MKPSEIIQEIYKSKLPEDTMGEDQTYLSRIKINSIIQYLDEEYTKNKPCEHEFQTKETNECLKCHLLVVR